MSNVRDFGAAGDGKADDSEAIQHAINDGEGAIEFPRGDYRITRTLEIDLARHSRTALNGQGGVARLLMDGPGPAIHWRGTHDKSADPTGFRPEIWQHERMPTIDGLEIHGLHPEADGIRLEGCMQPTLTRVLIRGVRTAVHITGRARNVLISHCHIFHNTGVGVHLDRVNLHQTIITGSHISYCRRGGIRIERSEIRNLQITGNDIEYNNNRSHQVPDADDEPTAEIFVDVSQGGSVREGTICSNTIQATYSPNGANIRFIGNGQEGNHRAGMWTISGNLIGSQQTNIHLTSVRGVIIDGNYIYSGHHRNLLVEDSRNVIVGPNCFGHNPDYNKNELATGVRLVDCDGCTLTGLVLEDAEAGQHTVPGVVPIVRNGLLELIRCRRMNISGSQILDGSQAGIHLEDCDEVLITGCTITDDRLPPMMEAAIRWRGGGAASMIATSRIGRGRQTDLDVPAAVRLVEILRDTPSGGNGA
jgi:hypothetical protein